MKTIFDESTRKEMVARIGSLNNGSAAQWGKMNVYQAIQHCCLFEEMMLGKKNYKQVFLGRLFGKMALRGMLKDDTQMGRNSPTLPGFIIKETSGDVEAARARWMELMQQYADTSEYDLIHPFFGSMTKEQIGYLVYKHADHHLRQFNA